MSDMTVENELDTIDVNVNIGPQHPATHGVFRMVLVVDGEKVVDLIPHIGYMHRGAEKLSENMDYRQAIGYQDRTEYLAQFNAEMCYVQAVEKLAGLTASGEALSMSGSSSSELNRISEPLHVPGRLWHRPGNIRHLLHLRLPRARARS